MNKAVLLVLIFFVMISLPGCVKFNLGINQVKIGKWYESSSNTSTYQFKLLRNGKVARKVYINGGLVHQDPGSGGYSIKRDKISISAPSEDFTFKTTWYYEMYDNDFFVFKTKVSSIPDNGEITHTEFCSERLFVRLD